MTISLLGHCETCAAYLKLFLKAIKLKLLILKAISTQFRSYSAEHWNVWKPWDMQDFPSIKFSFAGFVGRIVFIGDTSFVPHYVVVHHKVCGSHISRTVWPISPLFTRISKPIASHTTTPEMTLLSTSAGKLSRKNVENSLLTWSRISRERINRGSPNFKTLATTDCRIHVSDITPLVAFFRSAAI